MLEHVGYVAVGGRDLRGPGMLYRLIDIAVVIGIFLCQVAIPCQTGRIIVDDLAVGIDVRRTGCHECCTCIAVLLLASIALRTTRIIIDGVAGSIDSGGTGGSQSCAIPLPHHRRLVPCFQASRACEADPSLSDRCGLTLKALRAARIIIDGLASGIDL